MILVIIKKIIMGARCKKICFTAGTILSLLITLIGLTIIVSVRFDDLYCELTPDVVDACIYYTENGYEPTLEEERRDLANSTQAPSTNTTTATNITTAIPTATPTATAW